ncbi:MAG: hypothetical protein QJR08_04885 [Bacillota bacterium]|nr:hypothetical protein [Bacillota bacterium]
MGIDEFVGAVDAGLRQAGRALSAMLGQPVECRPEAIRRVRGAELQKAMAELKEPVEAVYIAVQGGLGGAALLAFSAESSRELVEALTGEAPPGELGEMERSVLAEVGNVTVTSFLNVLGERTGSVTAPSVPEVVEAPLATVVGRATAALHAPGEDGVSWLLCQARFEAAGRRVLAQLAYLPRPASVAGDPA